MASPAAAGPSSTRAGPILIAAAVTKTFPGVVALDNVTFEVTPARSTRSSARMAPANRRSSR
jgi:hypothetical protein